MSQFSTSVCCPQSAESDIESDVTLNQDSAPVLEAETVINTHNTSSQVEGSEDLKDLLTDEYCHICEAVLLFESQRTSHYEGKKHAQKVRLYLQSKKTQNPDKEATSLQAGVSMDKQKFCELCNMVFSSAVVARSHYEGKIHAKNLRRFRPLDAKQKVDTAQPSLPQAPDRPEAEEDETATSGSKVGSPASTQEVDLSDPTKHCRLCAASFNNPQMAQQHYSGRKHQRNQSRQQLLLQLGEDGETVGSLTCPICSITLSSVEMYQAHMQGNKHQLKEKKVADLCKSQKKVYDSFQDELADYIAVQKARGLQPKAAAKDKEREQEPNENAEKPPAPPAPPAPPSLFAIRFTAPPPRLAPPPFQSPGNRFAAWGRGRGGPRAPFWEPGYNQPRPNLPPSTCSQVPVARRPARGRSPDWSSSSSSWSGSSCSSNSSRSSSSSSSDSDDSRERRRRRQRRKHKERGRRERERRGRKKGAREGEEEEKREGEDERTQKRPRRRDRKEGEGEKEKEEEERRRRNERERRHRKEVPAEEREERKLKRERQRKRACEEEEDEERAKRRREAKEEEQTTGERENAGGGDASGKMDGQAEDRANGQGSSAAAEGGSEDRGDQKERHKHKHKKEKRRRERTEEVDTRTEEEKLWDETILGIF